jgi:hypothetical protein
LQLVAGWQEDEKLLAWAETLFTARLGQQQDG